MTTANSNGNKKRRINPWLVVGGVVIVLAICIGVAITLLPKPPAGGPGGSGGRVGNQSTTTVKRGSITGTVSGSGSVEPEQSVDLEFTTSGTVKQILVQEGDTVRSGQALAVLDTRELVSKVAAAQSDLDSAQATLDQKQKGNATAAEIASAQAAVVSAQANYDKVVAGPTQAALADAQAALASAQADYNAAVKSSQAGDATLRGYKATLDQAEVALKKAQAAYDKIAWRSDVGSSQEAADLQDATIDYQKALSDYNAQLATSGPDVQKEIASASASIQTAKKNLDDLNATADEIASAKATLESAKADLAKLTQPATASDIAIAQASVNSAAQALTQAQLNLESATLTAPFDGLITSVDINLGSNVTGTAISMMNQNSLHVDLKLSENDVVQVQQGMNVKLTSDTLSDWSAQGTLSYVGAAGETSNGVVTYPVRVNFTNKDTRIKVGMTANVDIVVAQKDDVLLVPSTALLPNGSGHAVRVVNSDGTTHNVAVEIGISDGSNTEIVSGVNEGTTIVTLPSSGSSGGNSGPGGPFGG